MGDYLSIGIAAKQSASSWGEMEKLTVPGFEELGVGSEPIYTAMEPEDEEDLTNFGREVA
jgi:hypothetical protein